MTQSPDPSAAPDPAARSTSGTLVGKKIVVTRSGDQAAQLADELSAAGAHVIVLPTIRIDAPADDGRALRAAVANVENYEWVIITSPNGARCFCAALGETTLGETALGDTAVGDTSLGDTADLAGVRIAAIGPGTAAVLGSHGFTADLIPSRYVAESLLEEFPDPSGTGRILFPRAEVARDILPEGLREREWVVDVVDAYRTVPVELDDTQLRDLAGADAITFASGSSVRNLVAAAGTSLVPPIVVTIGPVTTAEAKAAGLNVAAEADPHTIAGLVAAVTTALGG